MRTLGLFPGFNLLTQPAYAEKEVRKGMSAYLMKSLSENGLRVVLGSDFPVESHDWRDGVFVANITRIHV